MSEVFNGAANGAAQGFAVGGPWGAVVGGLVGGISGSLSKSKKKKEQKRIQRMLQKALNQYKIGSTDAFGNTLSADKNGRWSYNLSLPYKLQKISSDYAMKRLNEYKNLNPIEIQRKNSVGMLKALNDSAKASQGVAMSNALKQGSNIGTIATAFNRNRMANIQNSLLNAARSGQDYNLINANNINALAGNVNSIQQPLNNMQNNLQKMVNGLNKTVMNQLNNMAGAQYKIQQDQNRQTQNDSLLGKLDPKTITTLSKMFG